MNHTSRYLACILVVALFTCGGIASSHAQHYYVDETNLMHKHLVEIIQSKNPAADFHLGSRPYDAKKVLEALQPIFHDMAPHEKTMALDFRNQYDFIPFEKERISTERSTDSLSSDQQNLENILKRQSGWYGLYTSPYHAWSVDVPNFSLRVNPILDLSVGTQSSQDQMPFQNTRGIRIQGLIDNKIFFYTELLENQTRFLSHIENYIDQNRAIPGQAFFKNYQSRFLQGLSGRDYLNTQAYITVPISRHIGLSLGHGRHFIGHGNRSLLLSDFSNNYFYLKLDTKIWKLHYQNIFAELGAISAGLNPNDVLLPKKYMAAHYLSFRPNSNFEIGIFETVIFSREKIFELQYLNPFIFYRTVEQFLDSPDNVLLGLNLRYQLTSKISLYGQFILDEFKLSHPPGSKNWWGNKYGYQVGLLATDLLGVQGLSIRFEQNTVRPYTYSQSRPMTDFPQIGISSYTHYSMPLSHPLGANFREQIVELTYPIGKDWLLNWAGFLMHVGRDTPTENWGNDILRVNTDRVREYDNVIGQGDRQRVMLQRFAIRYRWLPGLFLHAEGLLRQENQLDQNQKINNTYFGLGLRLNIQSRPIDF